MMNERTKELMQQCGWINLDASDFRVGYFSGIGIEKFAELIVKECAVFVENDDYRGITLADRLKQHFGVE